MFPLLALKIAARRVSSTANSCNLPSHRHAFSELIHRVKTRRSTRNPAPFDLERISSTWNQCHQQILLTFCFCPLYFGVGILINCYAFLIQGYYPIGHIRPFSVLASRLVREREDVVVTFIVAPHVLDKTRAEISRQFYDEPLESSKALQRIR